MISKRNTTTDFPELDISRIACQIKNSEPTPSLAVGTFISTSIRASEVLLRPTPAITPVLVHQNEITSIQRVIETEIASIIQNSHRIPDHIHPYLYHYIGKNNPLADKVISFFENFYSFRSNPMEDLYRFSLIKKFLLFALWKDDENMAHKIFSINKVINASERNITDEFIRRCEFIKVNPEEKIFDIDSELYDSLEQLYKHLNLRCNAITKMLKQSKKDTKKSHKPPQAKKPSREDLIKNIDNEQKLMHLETRDSIFKVEEKRSSFQAIREVELARSEEIAKRLANRRQAEASSFHQNNTKIKQP